MHLWWQGDLAGAAEAYSEAAALWEGQAVVWFSLASTYSQLGLAAEGLAAVEKALVLDGGEEVSKGGGGEGSGGQGGRGSALRPVLLHLRATLVGQGQAGMARE